MYKRKVFSFSSGNLELFGYRQLLNNKLDYQLTSPSYSIATMTSDPRVHRELYRIYGEMNDQIELFGSDLWKVRNLLRDLEAKPSTEDPDPRMQQIQDELRTARERLDHIKDTSENVDRDDFIACFAARGTPYDMAQIKAIHERNKWWKILVEGPKSLEELEERLEEFNGAKPAA